MEPRMTKQRVRSLGVVAGLCVLLTAPAARGSSIVVVDISNDPDVSWTWAEDLNLGYSFKVTGSLTFNALAVFDVVSANVGAGTSHINADGLNASHQVGVWDADGNLLVSAIVDPTDPTLASQNTYGKWVYQTIAPTTLTAGTYIVGAFFKGNSDPVMVQQTAVNNVAGVTYDLGRYYYFGSFARPSPTDNWPPNEQQYFGATLLSVPDGGTTLSLLGGALVGLAMIRRRFRA